MKKKDSQKGKVNKKIEKNNSIASKLNIKFKIISKIDELNILAHNSYLSGNYQKAISYSNEIKKLAIQVDIQSYLEEQENFENLVNDKLKKENLITEIKDTAMGIMQIYESLIKVNKFEKAHEILADFKKQYENIIEFESIPIVQELFLKDKKEWIKFTSSARDKIEEESGLEEENTDSMLDDIQRFLKSR